MTKEYRISNKEFRMLKYGIARAAQALAPCVALSFLVNKNDRSILSFDPEALEGRLSTGRIPYFDIHHSMFDI